MMERSYCRRPGLTAADSGATGAAADDVTSVNTRYQSSSAQSPHRDRHARGARFQVRCPRLGGICNLDQYFTVGST